MVKCSHCGVENVHKTMFCPWKSVDMKYRLGLVQLDREEEESWKRVQQYYEKWVEGMTIPESATEPVGSKVCLQKRVTICTFDPIEDPSCAYTTRYLKLRSQESYKLAREVPLQGHFVKQQRFLAMWLHLLSTGAPLEASLFESWPQNERDEFLCDYQAHLNATGAAGELFC
ncbi:hypothetical protein DIPPA_34819 [Diplonema papillatum]|nr:hypothetical protein DIPPA_34819 [Diplonema papillatum]